MNDPRQRPNPFASLGQALADALEPVAPVFESLADPGNDVSEAARDDVFNRVASAETGLWLLALITLPDGRIFRGWRREDCERELEATAANMADLVLVHERLLRSVGALPDDLWSVLESRGALLLVRPFRLDFAIGGVFVPPATQGSARVSMRRLIKLLESALPMPALELSLDDLP